MLEALGPEDGSTRSHRPLTSAHLATLRIDQGRLEEAAELLEPFEDSISSCAPLAQLHLLGGRPDLAAAVLRRGLTELVGDALRRAPLLSLLVRAELQLGEIRGARAAADELLSLAVGLDLAGIHADAAIAQARVLCALDNAEMAVDAYVRARTHLSGGERPFEFGLVCLELAELMAARGEAPRAIAEARAALSCFSRLGASPARDRASALLRTLGDTGRSRSRELSELAAALTQRETEVLTLLAEGLSNAAIARRLFISVKTVEHHVSRILGKLAVHTRAEAVALATRLGRG
jgi:DNA-binding CsgD family transcriptional regulator